MIRFDKSAEMWEEALPIGNGNIGGMVYGVPYLEQIALNDDTLWSGYPSNHNPKDGAKYYKQVVEMTMAGKYNEAQDLIEEKLESDYTEGYLPLGDLWIETKHIHATNFSRNLSLENAISTVSYLHNDVQYKRESFVSYPDKCMVVMLTADKEQSINANIYMTTQLKGESYIDNKRIVLQGLAPSNVEPDYSVREENIVVYDEQDSRKGMRFVAMADVVVTGGKCYYEYNKIQIKNADSIMIVLCTQTSFNGTYNHPYTDGLDEMKLCAQRLDSINKDYNYLLERHIRDHKSLYDRVSLKLPDNKNSTLPTNIRLEKFAEDKSDHSLYALLFNFGRYLTIAGSREGTQATNLQGIWNRLVRPPWSSNFTVNINTEMNYWPTLLVNLPECHLPLIEFVKTIRKNGERTARELYGVEGFACHHNVDIWALTSPVGRHKKGTCVHAFWNASSAWLCRSLMDHYEYTRDIEYLESVYETIKSAALFNKNIMVVDNDSYIVCPSTSPETGFEYGERKRCAVSKTSSMSLAVAKEIFVSFIKCSELLGKDEVLRNEISEMLPRIKDYAIGSEGQVLEWDREYNDFDPQHRHLSHLYAMYPGKEVTVNKTPQLAQSFKKALEIRGDEGTGWSLGWRACLWARLQNGEKVLELLNNQLRIVYDADKRMRQGGSYPNLFGAHPPFQIDGNFAATAAVCEMFFQVEDNVCYIAPALPTAWDSAEIKGLLLPNSITLDVSCDKDKVYATLHLAGENKDISFDRGKVYEVDLTEV